MDCVAYIEVSDTSWAVFVFIDPSWMNADRRFVHRCLARLRADRGAVLSTVANINLNKNKMGAFGGELYESGRLSIDKTGRFYDAPLDDGHSLRDTLHHISTFSHSEIRTAQWTTDVFENSADFDPNLLISKYSTA